MTQADLPQYQWGQRVQAAVDLRNDGSYPDRAPGALLVSRGALGAIVRVGSHEETNTPVYLVEFEAGQVVGCREQEITRV